MSQTLASAILRNFLGNAPTWYKAAIVGFLCLNPLVFFAHPQGPVIAGWLLLLQFIFTLVMALKCYPLQPGGLLVIEAVLRVGKRAIVSFPNFAHWHVRLRLVFGGRMPQTASLPYKWYDTPNIHLCSIDDFRALCREMA